MTILLKVILFLFAAGVGYVFWYMYKDFKSARETEAFDELSPFAKLQMVSVFAVTLTAIASLSVLLLYFVVQAEIVA